MAEHVTTYGGGPRKDRRLLEMTGRFGGELGEVRGQSRRDADAAFLWLKSARARYRLSRVTRHVCHHDQGVGNCTDTVIEA